MAVIRRITAVAGWGSLAATSSWLWYTRQSHMQPLGLDDYLFHSTHMARLNPDNHPAMSDVCIREVPLSQIKPELFNQEGKLVEQFCAKTFGGIGMFVCPSTKLRISLTLYQQDSKPNVPSLGAQTTIPKPHTISGHNLNLLLPHTQLERKWWITLRSSQRRVIASS